MSGALIYVEKCCVVLANGVEKYIIKAGIPK